MTGVQVEDLSVAVGEMRFLEELYLANNMRIGPKGLSQANSTNLDLNQHLIGLNFSCFE